MRSNFPKVAVLLFAVVFVIACSESKKTPEASSEAPGPPAPVSGKTAFWAMFKPAYAWSNDMVALKLESKSLPGVKNDAGKAAMWSATFGSPRRRQAIEITYAVAAQPPDLVKGINIGHPIPWSGPSRDVMPIQGSDIVVDSDAAYQTAAAQAQPWLKTHPDKEFSMLLGNNPTTFARPVWYVLWGDTKSGYRVFVDSKSGELSKALK